jgi:heme-degrading monooxygenase HmoA
VGVAIVRETTARQEGDAQIVEVVDLIAIKTDDGLAAILQVDTLKVSPTETLATRLTFISSSLSTLDGEIAAEVSNRQEAIADLESATATNFTTVNARVDGVENYAEGEVARLDSVNATQDSVNASAFSSVNGRVDTVEGYAEGEVARLDSVNASQDSVNALAFSSVNGRVDTVEGYAEGEVARLDQVNVDQDTVSALAFSSVNGRVDTVEGYAEGEVARLDQVNVDQDTVSALAFSSVNLRVDSVEDDVDGLGSTVSGHSASIDQLLEVVVDPNGASAKAVLRLDVDGYVSGMEQTNDGTTSTFKVRVDEIRFERPDGTLIFDYDPIADEITMGNVKVDTLEISSVDTTNIVPQAVNNIVAVDEGGVTLEVPYYASGQVDGVSATITVGAATGVVRIDQDFEAYPPAFTVGSGLPVASARLVRVSGGTTTVLGSVTLNAGAGKRVLRKVFLDAPGAGTYTYKLQFSSSAVSTPTSDTWPVVAQVLIVTEIKR